MSNPNDKENTGASGVASSDWFDVLHGGLAPPKVPGSEFTYQVLVAISCENGRRFMDVDRYDTLVDGWERYDEKDGRKVVAWKQLPKFPSWILSQNTQDQP